MPESRASLANSPPQVPARLAAGTPVMSALSCAVALLAACTTTEPSQDMTPPAEFAGKTPVARYVGTLPCADCGGIRTDLSIYSETSGAPAGYAMRETYVATRDGDKRFDRTGRWAMVQGAQGDPDALVLQLDSDKPERERAFRKVGEQVLRALDRSRADLPSTLPRSLVRVPTDVPAQAVVLTGGDSRAFTDLRQGDTLVVMLAANRSTGYGWQIANDPGDVLASLGPAAYVVDSAAAAAQGAAGMEVFRFTARRLGQQSLRFDYRRPWEQGAPAVQTVDYTIRVR
jgi:predicted secreted protein